MAASRIIIRHLTGSKANRIEQFPIDAYQELSIGRNPSSTIQFDATNDDAVSRRHALITITRGDPPTFKRRRIGARTTASHSIVFIPTSHVSAASRSIPFSSRVSH
jgi:hypothetical protein